MDPIYMTCTLTRKVTIPINMVGSNLEYTLRKTISNEIAGKCVPEGFVSPLSIKLLTYTCGTVHANMVVFTCVFTCEVANPVEGHILNCVIENVTKAGLKCKLDTADDVSPCVIFVAKDHHFMDEEFNKKNVGEKITVQVIGQRFELNDRFISILGSFINAQTDQPEDASSDASSDASPDEPAPKEPKSKNPAAEPKKTKSKKTDKPAAEEPAPTKTKSKKTDKPAAEEPAPKKPKSKKTDKPAAEEPAAEEPAADEPAPKKPKSKKTEE